MSDTEEIQQFEEVEPELDQEVEEDRDIRRAFNLFDRNHDGSITVEELRVAMNMLKLYPTEFELKEMIREHDLDENGTIEFHEFILMMEEWKKDHNARQELCEAFKVFDRNDDGFICASELKYAMMNLGQKMTDEEVDEMIRVADLDGDNRINYEEYIRMVFKD